MICCGLKCDHPKCNWTECVFIDIKQKTMKKYMSVRNSVLKLVNSQWLHFKECETFKEAKDLADKLNK